nr:immunoglobulin heavy chain junction region [Mus musculus]
TAQGIPMLWTT